MRARLRQLSLLRLIGEDSSPVEHGGQGRCLEVKLDLGIELLQHGVRARSGWRGLAGFSFKSKRIAQVVLGLGE